MPRYEFRCRECSARFEVSRPMTAATAPANCPDGHTDTVKLLSMISVARGTAGRPAPVPAGGGGGGGCCGGACGCG